MRCCCFALAACASRTAAFAISYIEVAGAGAAAESVEGAGRGGSERIGRDCGRDGLTPVVLGVLIKSIYRPVSTCAFVIKGVASRSPANGLLVASCCLRLEVVSERRHDLQTVVDRSAKRLNACSNDIVSIDSYLDAVMFK